ncbi:phosphonate ABC transporter, permease protein PhnE [Pengzhenrongella sicca]|uniref:Phosphonate ABC transporter, permease protein PhnE n=1 Tax=Pengzhenrongella sicca TaxID=2819238 RepID=A0A8A4ZHV2_9MICO|nr:phosphonate ABC transporter, permease protein PhnE [Pengzhenrongella sicca]QTE30097.1 phosphonate ABC transporter, permease protein PhnE [Pengzhenrongella sicca]
MVLIDAPAPAGAPSTPAQLVRARPVDRRRAAAGVALAGLAVAAVFALVRVDISVSAMLGSWSNATRFVGRVGTITFPPAGELVGLVGLTLGLVICGTVLAAVLSVPVAYLAAANTTPGPSWRLLGRFLGVLARAVPDVVMAMVAVLVFSIGALPGIVAIGLHSVGMISKLFADAIEQIDEGPRLALRAAGATRTQEFISGVLPQVLPSWVATVLHRNDINLRGSVILGYVGVVGLGLEMKYAFSSLNYSLGLGIALVMFALCVGMEIISSAARKAMLGHAAPSRRVPRWWRGRALPARTAPRSAQEALHRPWDRERVRNGAAGWLAVAVVAASVAVCDIPWRELITSWQLIPEVAAKFWPPSFGNYPAAVMVGAMAETVAIAFAATGLTFVLSVLVGALAARNVAPTGLVRGVARFVLVSIRGIPELILAVVLIIVTGLGPQAGTLALAFCGIGLLGKLIADSFEEVDAGPERAVTTAGATRLQVFVAATFPQGSRALIGHTFYLLDTNIRAATILGIVGGGGIGYYVLNAGQGSNYDQVTAIVAMILVAVLVVEGLSMWIRRALG